jgi:hypothetical protein
MRISRRYGMATGVTSSGLQREMIRNSMTPAKTGGKYLRTAA